MLGDIMIVILHADDFDKATTILAKLIKDENQIVGVPESEAFSLYMDACIKNNDLKQAMVCTVESK